MSGELGQLVILCPQELQELRLLEKDPEMLEVVQEEEKQCLTEIEELEVWAACAMLASITLSMVHPRV